MKKDEIKTMVAVTLSLFATIAFVVWAFVSSKDGFGIFYAIASLFFSPLIWSVLYIVFEGLFQNDDE